MPFKPIETAKCPVCTKSVYAAEEKVAGGYKYHKGCFKCGLCGKFLDSTTVSEHEAQLFCKNCHARKYGPKGYGFGGGAGCLSMDSGAHLQNENGYNGNGTGNLLSAEFKVIKAPEGEGCPRCGGYVYAAEQMLARGRAFHKKCFKCADCGKGLDSTNCCEGPDKDIYCKVDYGRKFGPKGYGFGKGAGVLQMTHDSADSEHTPKNIYFDTSVIKAPEGEGCPRCGGVVYAAELVLSKGREWHRKCYKCHDCTKTLDSIIACDGPDKDVYCKTCYGKKWGPHGYGYACGSGFLQTDLMNEEEFAAMRPRPPPDTTLIRAKEGQDGCPRCGGVVFAAEQMLAKSSVWHKKCFNCAECHRPLDSVLACDGPDKEIHCKPCYGKLFGPRGYGYGATPTLSINGESIPLHNEDPQRGHKVKEGGCPRCGFAVYAAEQMIAKGKLWHKRCFSCNTCNRSLDSTNLCDAPTGEIFCKPCYGRQFGPKGFGFGMGAGTLNTAA